MLIDDSRTVFGAHRKASLACSHGSISSGTTTAGSNSAATSTFCPYLVFQNSSSRVFIFFFIATTRLGCWHETTLSRKSASRSGQKRLGNSETATKWSNAEATATS